MKYKILLKKIRHLRKKARAKNRLALSLLTVGFAILVFFVVLLVAIGLRPAHVDQFLPAAKTTAYIELNDLNLSPKLINRSILDASFLEGRLRQLLDIDYREALVSWARTPVGVAFIETQTNRFDPVVFVRSRSQRKAVQFFQGLALEGEELSVSDHKPFPIYSYSESQNFHFVSMGSFVFVAKNLQALETLVEAQLNDEALLSENEDYQQTLANLPRSSTMRAYVDPEHIVLKNSNPFNQVFSPLKTIVNHMGMTLRQDHTGFLFNQYVNIDKEVLSLEKGFSDPTPFAYALTDYIGAEDIIAYVGGANLTDEWQNTLNTITNINPAYGVILEGILRAQVSKIFGDEVDLGIDIYPLFEGEYALALSLPEEDELQVKLILGHENQEFVEAKLEKLAAGFRLLSAQFAPKILEFTLPDGTLTRELIADADSVEEFSEGHKDYEIRCVEVQGSSYGFCYTVTDDLMILANTSEGVQETIDLTLSPKFVLAQSQPFRQTLSNLSRVSDEITFVNIQNTSKWLKDSTIGIILNAVLDPFDAVTWVKHYFDDGVSTEGYLLLK